MCDVSVAVWRLSGNPLVTILRLAWPPTTRQKLSTVSWIFPFCVLIIIIILYVRTLFKLPGHSESSLDGPQFTSAPFSVLDRLLTRLSALYCQGSCQATILLENTGLLQLAQAVITLQIQALKKQNNSRNDSNNLPP